MARAVAQQRQQHLAAARAGRIAPVAFLHHAWLKAAYLLSDHSRSALILALFGFKVVEWWYTSAEERLAAGQALAPPPPPKAPLPDPAGCGLPEDLASCPLCRCVPSYDGAASVCCWRHLLDASAFHSIPAAAQRAPIWMPCMP